MTPTLATAAPEPAVPPRPVNGPQVFHIIAIPSFVRAASATVCAASAACDALLPPNPPAIVQRFDAEAWVIVSTPAGMNVASVTTDGASAEAVLEAACPPVAGNAIPEPRLVLYRVAPTVTRASLRVASAPSCTSGR